MTAIRPSTQIALDGGTAGQALIVDPTGAFWEPGTPSAGTMVPLTGNAATDLNGYEPVRFPGGLALTKTGQVLTVGAAGAFDAALVESPFVFFDPVSRQHAMIYVGYTQTSGNDGGTSVAQVGSLGLAFSNDLVNWTKQGQWLAGSGSGADASGCSGAKVVYDGSVYHVYYIGLATSGYEGTPTLCYATTPTLTSPTWTRHGTIIGASGTGWRSAKVYVCSTPVLVGSTYHIFINAADTSGVETIGHATATSLAGPWTVDDANSPVLNHGGTGTWDEHVTGDPGVFRDGDTWWMSYYGSSAGFATASDGWAYTSVASFPYGWTRHSANPILPAGASGSFDSKYAHKPFIYRDGYRNLHYYTGDDGTHRHIGLAIETTPNAATSITAATTVVGPDTYGSAAAVGTSTAYARADHHHGLPARVEMLVQDGVTAPPVGLETEARDDFLYSG